MTPEEQKRRGISDEDRKYLEEKDIAMKNKAKQSSGFYDKPMYQSPTPTPTPTYNDPLKRNMSYAERLARGARGASR